MNDRDIISVHPCTSCAILPTVEFFDFPKIRLICKGCGKSTALLSPEHAEGEWNRIA